MTITLKYDLISMHAYIYKRRSRMNSFSMNGIKFQRKKHGCITRYKFIILQFYFHLVTSFNFNVCTRM